MQLRKHLLGKAFRLAAAIVALGIADGRPGSASGAAGATESQPHGAVTFNKDIAPIVFRHCAACHRPGEVAPFSLLSYAEVSKRAEHIQKVTTEHAMPPWKPLPGVGQFANSRSLNADEIALVGRWVSQGAPEGQPADLPPTPVFDNGWQLGQPDRIITLDEDIPVPASGRDLYQNLVLDLKLPKGKFLRAAEFHPSNPRVVHHAVLYFDSTGRARAFDAAVPGPGFLAFTPPGRLLPGSLSIWTPGRRPAALAEGLSFPWPEKADLILQLHLHPSGKPEVERSSIGLYFTDEPPRRSLVDLVLIDRKIDIPAGEKAYRTHDSCTLPIEMEALSVFPHMHMIGKQIKVTAKLPDGKLLPMLEIADWDFNWQDLYQYAEPVRLPKGTEILFEGLHDNSADNPQNPSDPPKRVRWGEQTHDEMSLAFVNLTPVRESDMREFATQRKGRLNATIVPESTKQLLPPDDPKTAGKGPAGGRLQLLQMAKKADANGDGKLGFDEIVAAAGNRAPADEITRFLGQFDRDGDKQLDAAELAEVVKVFGGQ